MQLAVAGQASGIGGTPQGRRQRAPGLLTTCRADADSFVEIIGPVSECHRYPKDLSALRDAAE